MSKLVKTEAEIKLIAEAAKIVAIAHEELKKNIKPGVSLLFLDKLAEDTIIKHGGIPSFKGHDGFKHSICANVNDTVVHGVPNEYIIKDGDVVSIDVGVVKDGWNGDAAFTVCVGNVTPRNKLLVDTSYEALLESIKIAKPGLNLGKLGEFIESFAIKNGFTSTKTFIGHGIGKSIHEAPNILNYKFDTKEVLEEGMTICIEPIFIDGPDELEINEDDSWTVKTKDGSYACHVEHTIVITKDGGKILSKI